MESENNLSSKLIGVERYINIYDKNDELLDEISIDVSLELLQEIVIANDDDPLLYDGYELDEVQLNELNNKLQNKVRVDFNNCSYVLVTVGIYKWY